MMTRQHVLSLGARCPARSAPLIMPRATPVYFQPSRGFRKNRRKLEIVLLQDYDTLGMKGEVIKVQPGHGRNLLIPQKIAAYATKENRELYAIEGVDESEGGQEKDEVQIAQIHDQEFKKYLKQYTLKLEEVVLQYTRYAPNNVLAKPVTKRNILEKLWKDHDFIGLTEKSLIMPETLSLGDHTIKINLKSGWVAPGVGVFADFERLAEEPVSFRAVVEATIKLTPEQKEERAMAKDSRRDQRKANKENEAKKKKSAGKRK